MKRMIRLVAKPGKLTLAYDYPDTPQGRKSLKADRRDVKAGTRPGRYVMQE